MFLRRDVQYVFYKRPQCGLLATSVVAKLAVIRPSCGCLVKFVVSLSLVVTQDK